ncbi:hypothetical protein AB9M62_57125 [Bacillales bacterium AN1005]
MHEVSTDTLHLNFKDLEDIEYHLENTAGASLLGALGGFAYISRVTEGTELPLKYTKIEVDEAALHQYRDLVSSLKNELRKRNT